MPSREAPELTICTVSFESRGWLTAHRQLAAALNPGVALRWVVAENSPPGAPDRLAACEEGFEQIEGAPFLDLHYGAGSYHHGAGLNLMRLHIRTRFALFLDPDFCIVRPGWVGAAIAHMRRNGIALLGAPWHPSRLAKLRYFPAVHCLFVDLDQVPSSALDFTPGFDDLEGYAAARGSRHPGALRRIDPLRLGRRRRLGSSRDTGWRIYDHARRHPGLRVECLQPVYRPTLAKRLLEAPFPERLSRLPKRRGYFTRQGFREHGLPDVGALGWEEFMWRSTPFGCHVRCFAKRESGRSLAAHEVAFKDLVRLVTERYGAAPSR